MSSRSIVVCKRPC